MELCYNKQCKHYDESEQDNCGNKEITNKMFCQNYIRGPVGGESKDTDVIRVCETCRWYALSRNRCMASPFLVCQYPNYHAWEPIEPEETQIEKIMRHQKHEVSNLERSVLEKAYLDILLGILTMGAGNETKS